MKHYRLTLKSIPSSIEDQSNEIAEEFRSGLKFIEKFPRRITILGSTRSQPDNVHYQTAVTLSQRIAKELNYVVTTGGGPGIMEAANKGARDGGAPSVGLAIELPNGQKTNEYCTDVIMFKHFFSRKAMLVYSSQAYVFFPGGYGTFDELYTILDLVQTHKIPRVPIVLMGKEFWTPLYTYLKDVMYEKQRAIDEGDLSLFTITDNIDETLEIIKHAPATDWWTSVE